MTGGGRHARRAGHGAGDSHARSAGPGGRGSGQDTDERGSALLLMPAGLLIVLVLAAIAVDMALLHLRQRQAFDLAAAAANDAVTAGADQVALRSGGYRVDPAAAVAAVEAAVAASPRAADLTAPPDVIVTAEGVQVTVSLDADYLFADAIPGAPDGATVTATASATAQAPG